MNIQVTLFFLAVQYQGSITIKSQFPSSGLSPYQSRATVYHVQDSTRSSLALSGFTTANSIQKPVKKSAEEDMLEEAILVIGGRVPPKRRRDVPSSSYSRTGEGGVTAYKPGEEISNSSDSSQESQTDKETLTKSLGDQKPLEAEEQGQAMEEQFSYTPDGSTVDTRWTADEEVSSRTSGDQKPLEAEEEGQAKEVKFSFTAPDGSTVDAHWTADKGGFKVQGPLLPVFQLGLGRR